MASAVVTAWVAAVALTGCGGDGNDGPAADQRVLTTDAVRKDLQAALKAGGFGQPSYVDAQSELMRRRPCQVMGRLRTHTAPDRKAAERAVAELEKRGWQATEPMADRSGVGWALDHDAGWTLSFLSGVASEDGVGAVLQGEEQDGEGAFKGLSFLGFGKKCGQAGATASP
ncbi:hypothetical protein OG864_35650 [Streptomyces sp. NBC_00124]|uniref:hypothetical protein n=1 Tax=Streptomyces sp. NBC_00124 TaxID=2975662 RepID=UPI002256CBD7|nr:hypothetical protein [Streptomyces sp. NBC_00124]MCX5364020.1 hypothetical protein [Streptomyces sp. NBC_00124]